MAKSFFFFFFLVSYLVIQISAAETTTTKVELWCVAKNNAADAALQAAMDWACGAGGADCGAIQQGGACFDSGDVQSMASFAFNAYFLKNSMANHSCYFDNSAALTSLDPSHDKCKFPSSLAVSNGASPNSSTAARLGPSEDIRSGGESRVPSHWFLWSVLVCEFLVFFKSYLVWNTL